MDQLYKVMKNFFFPLFMERSNVQLVPACTTAILALSKNIKAIQLSPVKIRQIFPHHCSAKARWAHEPSDPEDDSYGETHVYLSGYTHALI